MKKADKSKGKRLSPPGDTAANRPCTIALPRPEGVLLLQTRRARYRRAGNRGLGDAPYCHGSKLVTSGHERVDVCCVSLKGRSVVIQHCRKHGHDQGWKGVVQSCGNPFDVLDMIHRSQTTSHQTQCVFRTCQVSYGRRITACHSCSTPSYLGTPFPFLKQYFGYFFFLSP